MNECLIGSQIQQNDWPRNYRQRNEWDEMTGDEVIGHPEEEWGGCSVHMKQKS